MAEATPTVLSGAFEQGELEEAHLSSIQGNSEAPAAGQVGADGLRAAE